MKGRRIYISGAISNRDPKEVRAVFERADVALRGAGAEVVNPLLNGLTDAHTWEEHMRADLKLLLDCDTIALLPGWRGSKGALLEHHVAKELGMQVVYFMDSKKEDKNGR